MVLSLAKDLRAFPFQFGDNGVNVFNNKCSMPDAQGIRKRLLNALFIGWRMVFAALYTCPAIWRPQVYLCRLNSVQPNYLIKPLAFQFSFYSFPLRFQSPVKEKLPDSGKVMYDDTYMI
jgi:hypothetical protein